MPDPNELNPNASAPEKKTLLNSTAASKTQQLSIPVPPGGNTSTVPLKKKGIKVPAPSSSADSSGNAAPFPAPQAAPEIAPRQNPLPDSVAMRLKSNPPAPAAPMEIREGKSSATMRLKLHPKPQSATPAPAAAVPPSPLKPVTPIHAVPPAAAPAPVAPAPAAPAPAAPDAAPSQNVAEAHTIKINRVKRPASDHGISATAPGLTHTAAPFLPGAKQTIKLRPSSISSGPAPAPSTVIPPPTATIKLKPSQISAVRGSSQAGQGNQTIKMVPLPGIGVKSVPPTVPDAAGSAPTIKLNKPEQAPDVTRTVKIETHASAMKLNAPAAAQSASAPTMKLNAPAAGQNPSAPTIKLNTPSAAQNSPSAPTMKLNAPSAAQSASAPTMKLNAPSAAQSASAPTLKLKAPAAGGGKTMKLTKPPTLQPPAAASGDISVNPKEGKQKDPSAKEEPGVVFLILSIVAFLVISISVFVMSAQYANMYYGKNIKIPVLDKLAGAK